MAVTMVMVVLSTTIMAVEISMMVMVTMEEATLMVVTMTMMKLTSNQSHTS